MSDWKRLGQYVIARRVHLGHQHRDSFADAAQINLRVLSDIENGRRDNFGDVTIAKLEAALGWETGAVKAVTEGGEPRLKEQPRPATGGSGLDGLLLDYQPRRDEALLRVLRSDIPDDRKRQIVNMLLAERDAAERRRVEHADELIRFATGEDPQP